MVQFALWEWDESEMELRPASDEPLRLCCLSCLRSFYRLQPAEGGSTEPMVFQVSGRRCSVFAVVPSEWTQEQVDELLKNKSALYKLMMEMGNEDEDEA